MKFKHIIIAFFLSANVAYGEAIDVLGQTLIFNNPHGYCTLGGSQREQDLFSKHTPPNAPFRVIHLAVLCDELEEYKNGKTEGVDHWVQIQLLGPNGIFKKVDSSKEVFLAGVAKGIPIVSAAELTHRINSALYGLDRELVNMQMTSLGRDKNAVYFSQKSISRNGGNVRAVTSFIGVTLANSLPISVIASEGVGQEEGKKQLQVALLQILLRMVFKTPVKPGWRKRSAAGTMAS